jgi:hypothetical protein
MYSGIREQRLEILHKIGDVNNFVAEAYRQILGREPDSPSAVYSTGGSFDVTLWTTWSNITWPFLGVRDFDTWPGACRPDASLRASSSVAPPSAAALSHLSLP